MSIQAVIMLVGALGLIGSTLVLVRRGLLSIRYGLGWLTVGVCGVIAAPLLSMVASSMRSLGFTPTGFSLGVFIAFLGLVCLQLSISLSGLHHAIRDLAEHAALVERRVADLEAREGRDPAGAPQAPTGDLEVSKR